MQTHYVREALELLQEAKERYSRDAQGRAVELVNEAIERLQKALDEDEAQSLSKRELLILLSRILATSKPLADLLNTVFEQLG